MDKIKILYILSPTIFWPITFIVLRKYFLYSMFFSTTILFIFTLYWFGDLVDIKISRSCIYFGSIAAITLYAIFYVGNYFASIIGFSKYVLDVYNMVETIHSRFLLAIGLIFIGLFEEVYWRGGLQRIFADISDKPWILSTILYTFVHISTLNPILVLASFIVGLFLGFLAEKVCLTASIIAHIIWLELILLIIPPI